MKRREFSRALVATTLAGTAVGFPKQSLAGDEGGGGGRDRGRDTPDLLALVVLILIAKTLTLRAFGIANPNGFLGLVLKNPVPVSLVSRAAGNKLPLIGKLFGMTVAQRLAGAFLVGLVFLIGSILMIQPRNKPITGVKKVIIVNKDKAYEPISSPKPLRFSNPQRIDDAFRGMPIGRAYQNGAFLIVQAGETAIKFPA